jgi:hypothetical protein
MKNIWLLIFFQSLLSTSFGAQMLQYNSLRIAYYRFGEELAAGLADGYLERASRSKYNYLLAEFHLDANEANPGIPAKKEEFRRAFIRAHEHGLRMIPKIQLGSKWSLHWMAVGNPNIQMNIYHDGSRRWGCPSLAYDADGIDASFEQLLDVLREAFEEASLPYDLEFVDLGHDEPVDDGYSLIGGVPDKVSGPDDSYAQVDRDFIVDRIENNGEEVSTAFQTLVVDELFRRAIQVRRILGENTRILVYGDLWDPEANGGIEKRTFYSTKEEVCYDKGGRQVGCTSSEVFRVSKVPAKTFAKMTPGIASLPGLSEDEKELFKNSIIVRPWCYYDSWPFGGDPDGDGTYNAERTFRFLADHGLKFVYTSVHHERPQDVAYTEGEFRAMTKFVRASRLFRDSCYGYAAAPWEARWVDPPGTPRIFDTLEELYELNRDHVPAQ